MNCFYFFDTYSPMKMFFFSLMNISSFGLSFYFTMDSQRTQYKWKIVACSALRLSKESEKKTWTLQESQWFDRKADCIKDFQTVIKLGVRGILIKTEGYAEKIFSILE